MPNRQGAALAGFVGWLLAGMAFNPAFAQIAVIEPVTTGNFDVRAYNKAQFSRMGLKLKRDFTQIGDIEIKKHLQALSLSTAQGFQVRSFDYDKANNIVIGTSVPDTAVEINLVKNAGKGQDIVVLFRGKDGQFKEVSKGEIGVFSIDGQQRDFSVKPFGDSEVEAYLDILLDRSGSMSGFIKDVTGATSHLMGQLPKNAKCRVTSFNHSFERHSPGFLPCRPELHKLAALSAGGGTTIYEPLLESYSDLAAINDKLKAVVIITDGVGSSKISKETVIKSKSAPTYVYWLGNYKEEHLLGVADTYIYGRDDVKKLLHAYVGRIGSAIKNQHVISTTNP